MVLTDSKDYKWRADDSSDKLRKERTSLAHSNIPLHWYWDRYASHKPFTAPTVPHDIHSLSLKASLQSSPIPLSKIDSTSDQQFWNDIYADVPDIEAECGQSKHPAMSPNRQLISEPVHDIDHPRLLHHDSFRLACTYVIALC